MPELPRRRARPSEVPRRSGFRTALVLDRMDASLPPQPGGGALDPLTPTVKLVSESAICTRLRWHLAVALGCCNAAAAPTSSPATYAATSRSS